MAHTDDWRNPRRALLLSLCPPCEQMSKQELERRLGAIIKAMRNAARTLRYRR
jgi:hypothetical protein